MPSVSEAKKYAEANDVFQKGLNQFQRNGRLLFRLSVGLRGQGLEWDAYWIEREAAAALGQHSLTIDTL